MKKLNINAMIAKLKENPKLAIFVAFVIAILLFTNA